MIRLLVTGTQGQVARALVERAGRFPEIEVVAIGRPQLDLENVATIGPAIADQRPNIIVNAAAYTAVDRAEYEPQRAFAINCEGAAAVAAAASTLGVPLIHLSTDYVFSGAKAGAYVEDDEPGPLGVYGKSKLAGERAVHLSNRGAFILRSSWIYSPFGTNFVKTMMRLARERSQIQVVDDQVGTPTSALDLAETILRIARRVEEGGGATFHVAGSGSTSWCGLAKQVFEASRLVGGPAAEVVPILTSEYPTPARRPANSRLDTSAFRDCFGFSLRDWRAGVEEAVRLIVKIEE